MATLSFTTGVVPVKITCGRAEISRARRVRAVVARANTDDDDVVARERTDVPENSRWIPPPAPPASQLKDGPKKVRFRDRHRGARASSPSGIPKNISRPDVCPPDVYSYVYFRARAEDDDATGSLPRDTSSDPYLPSPLLSPLARADFLGA